MLNFTDKPTNADQLLYLLYMGGYQVKVEADRLILTPAHAIDDELAGLILFHKKELVQKLLGRQHFYQYIFAT